MMTHWLRSFPPSAALFLAATFLLGCATGGGAEKTAGGVAAGRPLPAIKVQALQNGTAIDLVALRGKVLLIDLWASWCGPCKEELPLLDKMAARLKGKGIELIAISIDEQKADATAFLRSQPRWALTLAHDPEGKIPSLLDPPKMPTSYVVDRQGIIRHINAGFQREDVAELEDRLTALAAP